MNAVVPVPGAMLMLRRADAALLAAMRWFLVATVVAMSTIVFAQVVLRYGFNSGIDWADEVSRLAFVWCVFIAIPLAVRMRLHLGMEILVERIPARWRKPLARFTDALGAGLMLLVAWQSWLLARDQWDEKMATVNASAAWFVMAVAVGCALSAYELLRLMWLGQDAVEGVVVE